MSQQAAVRTGRADLASFPTALCSQAGAVCRVVITLKALRTEDRRSTELDAGIAGSAVRKYADEFAAGSRRATGAGSAAEAASEPFIDDPCWTNPADE